MADKDKKPDKFAEFQQFRDAGITDTQMVKFSNLAEQLVSKQIPILRGESLTDYKHRTKDAVRAKTNGVLKRALQVITRNREIGIQPPTPEPAPPFPGVVQSIMAAFENRQGLANRFPLIPGPFPPSTQAGVVGVPLPGGIPPAGGIPALIPAGPPAPEAGAVAAPLPGQILTPTPIPPPLGLTPDQAGPVLPAITAPPPGLPPLPSLGDLAAQPPIDPVGLPPGLPPLPGLDVPRTTATPTARQMRNILVPDATPEEAADLDDVLTEIEAGDLDLFDVGAGLPPGLPPLP